MQIVIQNLPQSIQEDDVRGLVGTHLPITTVTLTPNQDETMGAVVDLEISHLRALELADTIKGRLYQGQPLRAWAPAMPWA